MVWFSNGLDFFGGHLAFLCTDSSRAASSVGVTSPFQWSQHRKQFWRRADKKPYFTSISNNLVHLILDAYCIQYSDKSGLQVSGIMIVIFIQVYSNLLPDSDSVECRQADPSNVLRHPP